MIRHNLRDFLLEDPVITLKSYEVIDPAQIFGIVNPKYPAFRASCIHDSEFEASPRILLEPNDAIRKKVLRRPNNAMGVHFLPTIDGS